MKLISQSSLYIIAVFLCIYPNSGHCDKAPIILYSTHINNSTQPLTLTNLHLTQIESKQGLQVQSLQISDDPYNENSWDFRISEMFPSDLQSFVFEIEYLDLGAGVVDVRALADDRFNGQWKAPTRQVSYTRLNTGQTRSAYFQFDSLDINTWRSSDKPHFRISGLQNLVRLKAHISFSNEEWNSARSNIPLDVTPMVKLKRPMDIVCSAGVAVLSDESALQSSLDSLHELAPLAKVLGFNAIESYVKWNLIEPELGKFDFSFYDAIVEKLRQYDLQWFPLLIVGSAYALPDWFINSEENVGFVCLEHGLDNPIQSIWSPHHPPHVTRVLQAFGKHYEPMNILRGVRLGPSGNYGESQYPAGGNWGYKGQPMHIHIGFWAGDPYAHQDFQRYLQEKYSTIAELNQAWDESYSGFSEIKTLLPMHSYSMRKTLDMSRWYTESMSKWCEWWAIEARKAMPNTPIYQSAGGWGFLEAGTDYVEQAKSMIGINGGIRLTNETDSFHQNFFATRLAATAARLYGIDLGYEPASSHTARGTVGRIFNTVTTNGDHFFTYHPNIFHQDLAVQKWLDHYHFFDIRQDPVVDVAVYYPETMNQLDPGTFRYLYAWGFNPRAREVREHIEVDYLNEQLILEGYLNRYKALVFTWGSFIERDVEERIDTWIRNGGTVIYPSFPRGNLSTVEGDSTTFQRWTIGDTGEGHFIRFQGDMEPPRLYGQFVKDCLLNMNNLHPLTKKILRIKHAEGVYFSILEDGSVLAIHYNDEETVIELGKGQLVLKPYHIERVEGL